VFGHETVSILDGGFAAWQAAYPNDIASGAPIAPEKGNFVASFQQADYIAIEDVRQIVDTQSGALLLDGRTQEQFDGHKKHPKANDVGHIPGAKLFSQANAYDESKNRLKSVDELASIYDEIDAERIVSYCNTGHWAATNWFVLSEVLGRENVELYDGSMVEWTGDAANPLATNLSNLDQFKAFFDNLFKSS